MTDFNSLYAKHKDLSEDAQKKAGQAKSGKMGDEHESFLKTVLTLLDKQEINPYEPESILKKDVYKKLDTEWKMKVDQSLPNIADQLRLIVEFRLSKQTPDSSPQLQSMIDYLWQMKQKIEEHHDVFKI